MKRKKIKRGLISSALALSLTLVMSVTAFASYPTLTVPSSTVSTTGTTIKVAAGGATGIIVEMLGGNLVSGSEEPLKLGKTQFFMPIFGTDGNSAQDPWLHNAYYNTTHTPTVSNATTMGWTCAVNGIYYTGDPATIPILKNSPQLIICGSSDKTTLQASPYNYYSSDNSRYLCFTSGTAIANMISSTASRMETIMAADGSTSRYSDPSDIADSFNTWMYDNMSNVEDLVDGSTSTSVVEVTGTSGSDWTVDSSANTDVFNADVAVANGDNIGDTDGVMTSSEINAASVIVATTPALAQSIATATSRTVGTNLYVVPNGIFQQWSGKGPESALLAPWLAKKLHAGYGDVDTIDLHDLSNTFYGTYCHYSGTSLTSYINAILDGADKTHTGVFNMHGSSVADGSGDSTY